MQFIVEDLTMPLVFKERKNFAVHKWVPSPTKMFMYYVCSCVLKVFSIKICFNKVKDYSNKTY